ncbi:hypothetical protein [Streptomyces aureus]|uniref:Uncharacterized protein n=1 Tax=Streptomyces aureus TaxID=193461 RepID=A0ABV4SP22_9ACTN
MEHVQRVRHGARRAEPANVEAGERADGGGYERRQQHGEDRDRAEPGDVKPLLLAEWAQTPVGTVLAGTTMVVVTKGCHA